MKSIYIAFGLLAGFGNHSIAQPLHPEDIQKISLAAIEMCRGGTAIGDYNSHSISGSGDLTLIKIKGLVDVGINGSVTFEEGEWNGIKVLDDTGNYTDCITTVTPILLNKFGGGGSGNANSGCGVATTGGSSTGNTVICN